MENDPKPKTAAKPQNGKTSAAGKNASEKSGGKGNSSDRGGKPQEKASKAKINWRWIITIFSVSFFIAAALSTVSKELTEHLNTLMQFIILLIIIFIGIIFDVIGLAVATADEKQFHSMAARKIKEGKIAVSLIRNAEKVSSVCNDVVGDICGIVSGATAASIAMRVFTHPAVSVLGSLLVTGLVSAVTIGGKAIGKCFGMNYSEDIIYFIARLLRFFPIGTGKK